MKKHNFPRGRTSGTKDMKTFYQGSVQSIINAKNYSYLYYKDKNEERSLPFIKYWNDYCSKKVKNDWYKYTSNYKSPYGYMPW